MIWISAFASVRSIYEKITWYENSADHGQTALAGAVWTGSTPFANTNMYEESYYNSSGLHKLTVCSWLTVTSSILALKCGIHGGSIGSCLGRPMVGEGKVKSMLGGGTCNRTLYSDERLYLEHRYR